MNNTEPNPNPYSTLTIHRCSSLIWSEEDVDLQAEGHPNQALVENMSNADKRDLLEDAITKVEDQIMAIINDSIYDEISKLNNP